jgi:hypothetical protein
MNNSLLVGLMIVVLLVWLVVMNWPKKKKDSFMIEDNTVMGGYNSGPADFELEGPGNAAWSGY